MILNLQPYTYTPERTCFLNTMQYYTQHSHLIGIFALGRALGEKLHAYAQLWGEEWPWSKF